jgi:hypothetical protein
MVGAAAVRETCAQPLGAGGVIAPGRSSMPRLRIVPGLLLALSLLAACAPWNQTTPAAGAGSGVSIREPPGGNYVKASTIAALPSFFPGLGTLYVQPDTLPVGPFQAYDREGNLVSTIYMVPIAGIEDHKRWVDRASSPLPVTFVDIYYNAGHPGVPQPHYHIVLWHVSRERALSLQ